jgi:N-acetylgalactosamine kinase
MCGVSQVPGDSILEAFHREFTDREKARRAGGQLYVAAASQEAIAGSDAAGLLAPLEESVTIPLWRNGRFERLPASHLEGQTGTANLSVYLFRAEVLYRALRVLSPGNAQGEEYLTDVIRILAAERAPDGKAHVRAATVEVDSPQDVLTFNTLEELAEVDRVVRQREAGLAQVGVAGPRRTLRPISEWQSFISSRAAANGFARLYGGNTQLCRAKRQQHLAALGAAAKALGATRPVLVVRSPGRINLLGRHIDHRGGTVNVMAISEEILMVASPRTDDQVHLHNTNAKAFDRASFSIGEEISRLDWGEWLTCINSPKTLAMVGNGHWSNYVKAAALRLQHELDSQRLRGADILTHGTIPVGSGLSSSSAIVVGAAEVLAAVNGLDIRPSALVDLCGEGEWFVGTRGGSADHAAIKFAKLGHVAHVGFFPFGVKGFVPFLADHSLVVCNSGEVARKGEEARATFNSRVLGYVMAELIFKREFPEFASSIHHLRDITCENLGVSLADLYRMLKRIPVVIGEEELLARYGPFSPDDNAKLANLLSALPNRQQAHGARGLLMYCLAECERAKLAADVLRQGDADALGRLWQASHDGDRVVGYDAALNAYPFAVDVSDGALQALREALAARDHAVRHKAALHRQPGVYACSTAVIDLIVDLALRVRGVKGAQLAGAGLGGCAMILVERDAVDTLVAHLGAHGYEAAEYFPVEGAGPVLW